MALDNATVLENLKSQLREVGGKLNELTETRLNFMKRTSRAKLPI